MEQPCYKCGQTAEEGRVFCPHCGAPQIRVLVAEPVAAASVGSTRGLSAGDSVYPASQTVPILAVPVQWSRALKPCALAAAAGLLLMAVGLQPLVAMPFVGFLAVVFYRHWQKELAIRQGSAIRIGAFGGLLNSGLLVLFSALAAAVPESRQKMNEQLLAMVQKAADAHADNPAFQTLIQELRTPDGFVRMLIVACFVALISALVLGGLGGAIAGAIFRRRER